MLLPGVEVTTGVRLAGEAFDVLVVARDRESGGVLAGVRPAG